MLKMNYSDFKGKNYNQLIKECERRGVSTFSHDGIGLSADDLVGKIIAHDAYFEGRNDAFNGRLPKAEMGHKNSRRKYCLRCEDSDPHYIELTEEQYNLLRWCIRKEIFLPNAEINEMNEIKWEAP